MSRDRGLAALGAALVLVVAAAAPASAAPPGSTVLVDRPSGLGALPFDGNNDSVVDRRPLSARRALPGLRVRRGCAVRR
jgi:hypothetical protein